MTVMVMLQTVQVIEQVQQLKMNVVHVMALVQMKVLIAQAIVLMLLYVVV